jgi:hypothetical protein
MTLDPGPGFLALIEPHTGRVTCIRPPAGHGFSTDLLAIVECEQGPFFVKAMRNRVGGRRDQILREKEINPFVRSTAPALLWSAEDDEWIVLGFEVVEGRETDFMPGSPDLPVIVELLNRIHEIELPEVAKGWPETRWDWFADRGAPALFQGDALLHTDVNPANLLIGERESWAVDWSWPTRGAAFIDPAMLVVQLVVAGHAPEGAESWAAACTAWTKADPEAIDAFALAHARKHRHRALRNPDERWLLAMAEAAEGWARYRGVMQID